MATQMPNIMVMIRIAELYPNRIVKYAIYDEDKDMWSAALMKLENGLPGETIYSLDCYCYETDDQALMVIDKIMTYALDTIKIMSN